MKTTIIAITVAVALIALDVEGELYFERQIQQQKPTYTQRQVIAYDFLRDNPKSRAEVCSKRFKSDVMDSDGGGK